MSKIRDFLELLGFGTIICLVPTIISVAIEQIGEMRKQIAYRKYLKFLEEKRKRQEKHDHTED